MFPSERCGEELPLIAQCPLEAKNPSDSKKVSDKTVVAFKAQSDKMPLIARCPLEAKNPSDSKKVSDNTVVALKAHSDKKMNEFIATKLSNPCNVGNDCVMRSFLSADLPHFGFSVEEQSENHGTSSHELIPSFLNETGANSPFPICENPSEEWQCQESQAKDDRESLREPVHQFSGHVSLENSPKKLENPSRFCQFSSHSSLENPQKTGEDRARSGEDNFACIPESFPTSIQPENHRFGVFQTQTNVETLRTRGTELNSGVPADFSGQLSLENSPKSVQNRVENPSKPQEIIFSGQKRPENPPQSGLNRLEMQEIHPLAHLRGGGWPSDCIQKGQKVPFWHQNSSEPSRKAPEGQNRPTGSPARETGTEPEKRNFHSPSGPMVRMPPPEPVRLTGVGSNPSGVPKVHCTLTLGPGTPKVQCTPTLAPGCPNEVPESRIPIPLLGSNDDFKEGYPNRGSYSHQVSMTMLESDHENTPHTCPFESSLQRTTMDHCEGSKLLSHWLLHCDW